MIVVKDLTFGKVTHPVAFTSNALYKLEKETGLSTERIAFMMATGRAGFQMMQVILWAGLEAARLRNNTRREPFTLEEVGNLLDEEGGSAVVWAAEDDGMEKQADGSKIQVRERRELHPIGAAILEAWASAFPKPRAKAEPSPKETPANGSAGMTT